MSFAYSDFPIISTLYNREKQFKKAILILNEAIDQKLIKNSHFSRNTTSNLQLLCPHSRHLKRRPHHR